MTLEQIFFLVSGALVLSSALMVVTSRNLIRAAFWLIAALFGVAVLYILLQAAFLAVVQVVVYIGAIAILFIFAVMLTRRETRERGHQLNRSWWFAALIALVVFSGIFFLLRNWEGFSRTAAEIPTGTDTLGSLGVALLSPDAFVLPFEVASVLLLAALIGAVYVAYRK